MVPSARLRQSKIGKVFDDRAVAGFAGAQGLDGRMQVDRGGHAARASANRRCSFGLHPQRAQRQWWMSHYPVSPSMGAKEGRQS